MMENIISKIRNNRNWGIILLILAGLNFLAVVVGYIIMGIQGTAINIGKLIVELIYIIAVGAVGAYMFYFRRFFKPMLPITVAVIALTDVLQFFFSGTFSILYILDALCLGFIAYAIFEGKRNLKLAYDFCIGMMLFNVLWAMISFLFHNHVHIGGYFIFQADFASRGYLGLALMIVLALYIYKKMRKEPQPEAQKEEEEPKEDKQEEIIAEDSQEVNENLKKLLEMTEKQFEAGEITEKEYIRRKTEIISRM